MKIAFNKKLATIQTATLREGRHIGTVIQIAGLGDQPAFESGGDPVPSLGIVVQVGALQIAKKMRISESPLSVLFGYLDATLPDPDGYDGDNPLPLTLGRPVAIEVVVKGVFVSVDSFNRPEDFELGMAPTVATADLVMFDGPEALAEESGKAILMKLHRDIRSWLSKRVRS